jgi:hypothetical protein
VAGLGGREWRDRRGKEWTPNGGTAGQGAGAGRRDGGQGAGAGVSFGPLVALCHWRAWGVGGLSVGRVTMRA